MKDWTIGKRIIVGETILMVLLLIVGGIGLVSLTRLKNFASLRLRDDAIPGLIYGSQMAEYSLRSHIRALMAGNAVDPAKRDHFLVQMEENIAKVSEAYTNYEASITQAEDRKNFDEVGRLRAQYRAVRADYFALIKAGKAADAEAFVVEKLDPAFASYRDQMELVLKWNQNVAGEVTNSMVSNALRAIFFTAIVVGASLLLAVVIGWAIIRGTNQILKRVAGSLNDGALQVVAAAGQVSASSQNLAEGSSEQASSLEETGASLEEMSSMTKRNSENASKANELAKHARSAADRGVGDMESMASAMNAIKGSSDDIAKIIKTIDEIAFQTNILALNAAVEAARAGEAGMGFAVVADEVRNLAQRCAQAAKETASKIEDAIAKSGQGVEITTKVAQALNEIVQKVRQVDELVTDVATASREQSDGITQINNAVGQMDKVTQSNAATAEESAAAAEELNAQAEAMKHSVADLLRLVGGEKQIVGAAPSVPLAAKKIRPSAGEFVKRSIKVVRNGHAHPEAATGASKDQLEIAMDGGFRDC
jgi:methyl-accepting chemotaxis protein